MARTPSMTVAEAESQIGPRPIVVTSTNRGIVRKWFVAKGLPSGFVGGLSMRELQLGYNDISGDFARIQKKLQEAKDDGLIDDEADVADVAADVAVNAGNGHANGNGAPVVHVNPVRDGDVIEMLRNLLGGKVDEGRVVEIVRKELEGRAMPPRDIHVKINDGPVVEIKGQHKVFERVLKRVAQGDNVLLVGPAGCGKSHLCGQIAKALGRDYGFINGSAGVSESALIGWLLPVEGGKFEYQPSQFVEMYEKGNAVFCLDEFDAFDGNMMMAAQSATSNGHMTVYIRRHAPLVTRGKDMSIIATANTYGTGANPIYNSRNAMDGATMDRYTVITMDYDKSIEEQIGVAGGLTVSEMADIWTLRDKVRESGLRRVISTRAFQKAAIGKACGETWSTIMDTLVEGWTRDERAKAGLKA